MNTITLSEMRQNIESSDGMHIQEDQIETIKLLINKYNSYVIPSVKPWNSQLKHEEILLAIDNFDGSYDLALFIKNIFSQYGMELEFMRCVQLANRIWSIAYPNYPYKVLWHDGCQGYFEIWKEIETNRFYIECDECSLQFESVEHLLKHESYIREPLGISVYPTMKEIKNIGWDKYIINK